MSNKTDAIKVIAMTEQETIKELEYLADLYHERKKEFSKASRIRWLISFVGFGIVFSFVLIGIAGGDIEEIFSADIRNILIVLLAGMVMAGFHFLINVSVFGWLFQKDIAEGRRLDDIEKRIRELEKTLK